MPPRQTLPTRWLFTDRRLGEALWAAIDLLPSGAGVMLRHHDGDLALGERVAAACAERGLFLGVAGDIGLARRLGARLVHNPVGEAGGLLVSRSVHDPAEALAARSSDLVFVSPVYPSTSHPGAEALGIDAALALAQLAGVPAVALGGIDAGRGEAAIAAGFFGWAAIGEWVRNPGLSS